MERTDKGTLTGDKRLAAEIGNGDARSWEEFVRRYTGWALYRANRYCKQHCAHRHSGMACGLTSVSLRLDGMRPEGGRREECDEGMDTYIWIMEQLRKRIPRYSGKNGSRLSTFVWTILNSRELHVDWLRWKYGRVF